MACKADACLSEAVLSDAISSSGVALPPIKLDNALDAEGREQRPVSQRRDHHRGVGRDGIRKLLTGAPGGLHLGGPPVIELDGDQAEVRTYLISQHIRESAPGPVKHYFLGGEYADRVVRTPDGWRIAYRRLDRMWKQGDRAVISAH